MTVFKFQRRYRADNGREYYMWRGAGDGWTPNVDDWPMIVIIEVNRFWHPLGPALFCTSIDYKRREKLWSSG